MNYDTNSNLGAFVQSRKVTVCVFIVRHQEHEKISKVKNHHKKQPSQKQKVKFPEKRKKSKNKKRRTNKAKPANRAKIRNSKQEDKLSNK